MAATYIGLKQIQISKEQGIIVDKQVEFTKKLVILMDRQIDLAKWQFDVNTHMFKVALLSDDISRTLQQAERLTSHINAIENSLLTDTELTKKLTDYKTLYIHKNKHYKELDTTMHDTIKTLN